LGARHWLCVDCARSSLCLFPVIGALGIQNGNSGRIGGGGRRTSGWPALLKGGEPYSEDREMFSWAVLGRLKSPRCVTIDYGFASFRAYALILFDKRLFRAVGFGVGSFLLWAGGPGRVLCGTLQ
jgi:hypothetical protein